MELAVYRRRAQYYETDQMGIIHHSNYIRWFEEARVDFMERMGCPYGRMEAQGIASPLLGVSCRYRAPVRFGEVVLIEAAITAMTGARMRVAYRITREADGVLCTTGETEHCFTGPVGRPVSLKKADPTTYALFCANVRPLD